jgi:hypothetical protein
MRGKLQGEKRIHNNLLKNTTEMKGFVTFGPPRILTKSFKAVNMNELTSFYKSAKSNI